MTHSPGGALAVLLIQTGASCFMTGLTWTMQILSYPLLALVGAGHVPGYEQAHNRRFIRLVGPGVAIALASAVVMTAWRPPGSPSPSRSPRSSCSPSSFTPPFATGLRRTPA